LLTDNDLQMTINLNMAAILFALINVLVRVLAQGRSIAVRLVTSHVSSEILLEARRSMLILWESRKSENFERGNFESLRAEASRRELLVQEIAQIWGKHTFCALADSDPLFRSHIWHEHVHLGPRGPHTPATTTINVDYRKMIAREGCRWYRSK